MSPRAKRSSTRGQFRTATSPGDRATSLRRRSFLKRHVLRPDW
jgi:hypothetical protein